MDQQRSLGVVATAPFSCECGQAARRDGDYWVCATPHCDGYQQICRPLTDEERRLAEELSGKRFPLTG